jgi:GT2 family glycosyltransferase
MELASDLPWELLIVNNNSTDHTDDVIGEYVGRLPIRREFESRGGRSNALNRAIDVAKGDYIVWIDDDVLVDPGLLTAYATAFRRWPEAAVFGGRIKPKYEASVEKWVLESEAVLGGPYAIRDFRDHVYPLSADDEGHFPYGANWAFRAIEQRAFRYDPNLGPVPNRVRVQEDTDLMIRLLRSGATGYWIPEAIVEHCIGRDRQTVRYIADYYESWGETPAFRNAAATPAEPFLVWHTATDLAATARRWVLYRVCRFVSSAAVWVKYLERYSWNKGMSRYTGCKERSRPVERETLRPALDRDR